MNMKPFGNRIERDMLAMLDRSALERLAKAREIRAVNDSHARREALGRDTPSQSQSLLEPR